MTNFVFGAGVRAAWSRPVLSGAGAGANPIGDLGPGAGALAVQKSSGSATLLSSRVGHRVLFRSECSVQKRERYVLFHSFPFFSRVFGDL